MASYKNLGRIAEIARDLPKMEEARKLLADFGNEVEVIVHKPKKEEPGRVVQGTIIILPKDVKMNILNVLNLEINKQKEELKGL